MRNIQANLANLRQRKLIFFLTIVITLGIYLAISYLLTPKITNKRESVLWRRLWQGITAIILIYSLVVCGSSSLASTWWGWSEYDVEIPAIIQQAENPLVISDRGLYEIMPFSHQLNSNTNMILLGKPDSLKITDGFDNVFFDNPSQSLLSVIKQQNIEVKEAYKFKDTLTSLEFFLYQVKKKFY